MRKLAGICVVAAACGNHASKLDGVAQPQTITAAAAPANKAAEQGLELRLTTGKQGAQAYDRAKLAAATKLSDADTQALLARGKPLAVDASDRQAFALRPASTPAPRTGQTVHESFPPPPGSLAPPVANVAQQPLAVSRYMPEGAVPIAPELSVTFNQPMIAVTSQEDAAKNNPVKLSPTPKGKWRWLGTRTILFDPDPRFPQATTYTVEVPAGTRSASGQALAKAVKFTFETPPPKLVSHSPDSSEPQKLDVPMFLVFDQKIDQQAVFSHLQVTAQHGWDSAPIQLHLLDAKEIAANKPLATMVESAKKGEQDGRWLAVRAASTLPPDTTIEVKLPAGTPSAEGPNPTKEAQSFSFHTYPPLRLVKAECGYERDCRPGMAWSLEFNNPLDTDKDDEQLVSISPDLPGAKIQFNGNRIYVQALAKPRTTYKVTVGGSLLDEFGQTLGHGETRTFDVGDATPTFFGPSGLVVLDPEAAKPTLDFFTTNYSQLKVRLYQVEPSDFDAYAYYLQNRWNHDHPPPIPGKLVFDSLIQTTAAANELGETHVDLRAALGKHDLGHVIAVVEPSPWKEKSPSPQMVVWAQATKLAVDAHVDGDQLVAFASDLSTGKAAAGVDVELRPYGVTGKTDERGVASLPLAAAQQQKAHYVVARRGDDVAFLAENAYGYGDWFAHPRAPQLAWYVIDDRKLYKPGEEVSLKGWLRVIDHGKNGDVGALAGRVDELSYLVYDSRGVQIGTGNVKVDATGGFDTKFTLPKTPNLGYARVQFSPHGQLGTSYSHSFQIEEFRRPEFEVSAQASQGPFVIGGSGDVTVSAKYYAGGPLPGAQVSWYVTAFPTTFTPPNRDDYVFGTWTPWWGGYDFEGEGMRYTPPKQWTLQGTTDASGAHVAHMDFLSVEPPVPMSVTANANVMDVNRQSWSASSALIVHPSTRYVGLKMKKPFVEKGTPFELDVIGVDLDGKATPGAAIDIKAERLDWTFEHGKYTQKRLDPQSCDPAKCRFQTPKGGTYEVVATITDDHGRKNQTKLQFWVTGGESTVPSRDVAQERVQLIPDKKEYAPGDTAELMVQAPFYPAEGVLTWRRSGIVKVERIALTGPTTTVKVPIADAMTPNLYVQVDLVGAAARTDDHGKPDPRLPKRPAYAVGSLALSVPPKHRTLAVTVAPAAPKLGPGEATKLTVEVKDAHGRPMPDAEVAVIAVDEAILSLTGYQFPDPIATFYPGRDAGARDHYERAYVKLARPDASALTVTAMAERQGFKGNTVVATTPAAGPGGGAPMAVDEMEMKEEGTMGRADGFANNAPAAPAPMRAMRIAGKDKDARGGPPQPIAVRSNFNPLAAFAPAVKTGADGRATVDIKVPDNLTRYRVVAIAVAGEREFGKGESAVTARLPLMVRPSPPRFLNFGDTFQLPVVVQNQTDQDMTVQLAVRAANARLTDGAGRQVTVPANDRVEVQFPAAAESAGTARFEIVTASGAHADASELSLPVWTPATTEAFATYGVIDDGAMAQPIALPGQVVTQFGGLQVTTASTNLQSLTDAIIYLVHYPYDCAEQRSSRILAIAALRDVLAAFHSSQLPSAAAMEHSVDVDIEHLSQMQNTDGGFAFWDRGYPSEPYLSVFVGNALARAKAKGFTVPDTMIARVKPFLANIEAHYPSYYGTEIRRTISAFALYTRRQLGDRDLAKAKKLLADAGGPDKLSMEADGWLLGVLAGDAGSTDQRQAIVRYALNHVSETAGAANFTTSYGDGAYLLLASERRVDGVMLESLIQEQPQSDVIPKLVTGLLAHRKAGHWLNTQENAFVLQALDLYFRTYEKVTPDFVARVWLGADYAGDHAFRGRTTESAQIDIAMKDVATHDHQPLTIQKDGKGRLYYRIGMTYAPASLKLEPADYGFVVERRYEGVDDAKDVTRSADGVWHVKAGTRVRVRLKMMNENRRYHVALVDPLPAGFEPMNPALATTGPLPADPNDQKARGAYWWWYGPWYEHQNMRDERVEAFASLLWEGVHSYDYVARATTPGNFVVPPPKAEEMYMPETFGRGGSDRVVVE